MEQEQSQSQQTRVRANVSLTAKGTVQWDITAEFPSVEQTVEALSSTIDKVREMVTSKNLKEAGM